MNESMLQSFLQILAGFAIATKEQPVTLIRKFAEGYVERNFGKNLVQSKIKDFDEFLNESRESVGFDNLIKPICVNIIKEFSQPQRFLILIHLFNFFNYSNKTSLENYSLDNPGGALIDFVAKWLKLNLDDYLNCKYFALGQLHNVPQKQNLIIAATENPGISDIRFLKCEGISGHISFLHLTKSNLLIFYYKGSSKLEMYGKPIFTQNTYIFSSGFIISVQDARPIYYGEVYRAIMHKQGEDVISLDAQNITYRYSKTEQGIKNLTFSASNGELHGILGGSGVGKSTLIKLLCGNFKPQKGQVLVNGRNLHNDIATYKGLIGVLHQEECLIEELTVFENLYLSAKASLGNISKADLIKLCEEKLFEFDLSDCKNNRVGPPDNRQLSGGQRKRLAIAMEIIREPKILFVDEPTSGLSSADSEIVMNILKSIALEGKLVLVNIHQPSSEVFKLFDNVLIIDRGGVPAFCGQPLEAILHFKQQTDKVDKHQSGCQHCGAIKPESIFEMLEERSVDELGQRTTSRKFPPSYWHNLYLKEVNKTKVEHSLADVPKSIFSLPKKSRQFATFFTRNLITKIRNLEFLFFALVLPPALAIIISLFLRYSITTELDAMDYSIYSNPNIPSFFLMCILSAMFFGLIVSCEDIVRDKRIIIREQFIGLDLKCYYNAKFLFLVLLSGVQTIFFILPGILILEVKGITFALWLLLFLLSILGNLLGLILSSTLKSVVAIYILVPFLLIPQILFSGLVVRFDNLNPRFTSHHHVPLVGETMPSRWAVEAVTVRFFMHNKYIKPFFSVNFKESELRFRLLFLIPELNAMANRLANNPQKLSNDEIELLNNGLRFLATGQNLSDFQNIFEKWTDKSIFEVIDYINYAKDNVAEKYTRIRHKRDGLVEKIFPNSPTGREKMSNTRQIYHNLAIEDIVRYKHFPVPFVVKESHYIQKVDPIYLLPNSKWGRAHFYAPYKQFSSLLVDTYWFNTVVLVLFNIVFYLIFLLSVFPRMKRFF